MERIIDEGILTRWDGIKVGDSLITQGARYVKPGDLFRVVHQE